MDEIAQKYFMAIKEAIASTPIFAKPYFSKDAIIYTNAMEEAISWILLQENEECEYHPIAFMSQTLSYDE